MIDSVGVFEALWLRTAFAALLLVAIRPSALRRLPPKGHRLPLAALALTLFLMNLCFYGAISRIPVGIVVAIEFVGPLGVAVLGTRRKLDWLWIVAGRRRRRRPRRPFRLRHRHRPAARALGRRLLGRVPAAGQARRDRDGPAVGHGAHDARRDRARHAAARDRRRQARRPLGRGRCSGLVIAVVSSAFPYWLELVAIRRVRAATYGVLLSIEPAVAALAALVVLGQRISPLEAAAMAAVMAAAAGASWTTGGAAEAGVDLPAP